MEGFELISSAIVSDIIPIKKYRSKATGITVCIANVEGPLVNGYFCLATEAHDDDGLPHTLEHIVFMGSEKYPYKGLLDLYANRCLAQGTNAWTDVDHTCYTMTTAGSEGFLNLIPIYLDHLLYPTIKEAHYTTEVHHINGEGEDAGIVYCEMQARENSGSSLTHRAFVTEMYPGHCGYKSETGGIMKNLRETCSHKKVKDYHTDFYRADNLCLIITGNVKPEEVFEAIKPFEEKIKSKKSLPPLTRPWMSEVPPLTEKLVEKRVLFPTEDESVGTVTLGWRGPSVNEYYEIQGIKMLFNYLTDTPVAPLQRDLVEIEEPLCGDIDFSFFENKETAISLAADNVPKENLDDIKTNVLEILGNIASGKEEFDMERMKAQIHRSVLEEMNAVEDSPHDTLAFLSIGDFLYSTKSDTMQEYVDKIKHLQKLKEEPVSYWTGLMKKYLMDQKMVVIIGDPSEEKMEKSGEEEKARVKRQREELGEEGLAKKKKIADDAIAENSVEPPTELITQLKVPSTDSVTFHNVNSYRNYSPAQPANFEAAKKFPLDGFPAAFNVCHVQSLFTQIYIVIDSAKLSNEQRMLLPLYTELLYESPILRDGKVIPYEEVVKELAADTLYTDAGIGIGGGRFSPGSFSSTVVLSFKVENEKYEKGVRWARDVLYNLQFSTDRIKTCANKIVKDVPNHKRNGRRVVKSLLDDITYNKESNVYAGNMVRQHDFLSKLIKDLDQNSSQILSNMESLRTSLLRPENFRYYVIANLNSLPKNPHQYWFDLHFKESKSVLDLLAKVPHDLHYLSNERKLKAIGVGSVESAFMYQVSPAVDSYQHPDYPAILVFIEYLCALEGPLWRQIRGCGYSYHYRMSMSPDTSQLTFVLARSTHIFAAYKTAKEIVDGFVSGKTPFDESQVDSARSGIIYQLIAKEQTISSASLMSMISEFKEIDSNFRRDLLKKISNVTIDDLKMVGKKYFVQLFDPSVFTATLCCHPTKIDEILKSFGELGINYEKLKTLEEAFLK